MQFLAHILFENTGFKKIELKTSNIIHFIVECTISLQLFRRVTLEIEMLQAW